MSRKLNKAQQAFAVGRTIEQLHKQEVKLARWELLAEGIAEAEWIGNEVLCEFARRNKDRYFVPESFLAALRETTAYDAEPSAYSLVDDFVIPEPLPLEEVEVGSDEPQNQVAA